MFILTLKIYGKVQNVGFRDETEQVAKKLNLSGYVKNEADGTFLFMPRVGKRS
jgi:acylphosphatase